MCSLLNVFEITGDSKDECICPRQVDKPFLKSKMSFFVMYNIGLVPKVPGNSTLKGRIGVHGLSFKLRFPDSETQAPVPRSSWRGTAEAARLKDETRGKKRASSSRKAAAVQNMNKHEGKRNGTGVSVWLGWLGLTWLGSDIVPSALDWLG